MHNITVSAAVGAAMMSIGPTAFAQASSPVSSSVFVHRSFDTGNSEIAVAPVFVCRHCGAQMIVIEMLERTAPLRASPMRRGET
ncbi:hypothetical protein P0D73_42310 [Paraburkholderia sp. RL18-101-BIB-B]|uniref:hypothetical protein n=1 Tax=unclassified Paraburkholderia TaxID=2615204 RepID=UPI0038BB4D2F